MINWDILKQPWNWFVVAFTLILVLAIAHFCFRDVSSGENC